MTERELIRRVKKRDDEACRIMIERYHNFIFRIINSYTLDRADYRISVDELFQEACIGLYEACRSFNKSKNCSFPTFAYVVMKRRISRSFCRQLNIYQNEGFSYDKLDNSDKRGMFEGKYVYDNPIVYKKYDKKEADTIISKLNKLDQQIVQLRLQDYSYEQISNMLNISKKKVDNRLQFLKRRIFNKN